ncbi:MAG: dTMP kinase [Kiritimatiellae bacterium]|nr:dTMP kinase [Kiritimatiellia bacterium]
MYPGKFITFEGGEACGKSTQIRRFADALRAEGREVLLTREPGGTRLSELVRGLLKDEREDPPVDRAELLLFLAARAQLVKNVIRPALAKGVWVVSDRFCDSTFAYQGYGRGMPLDAIRLMNAFATEDLKPDLTFLLDVPPETARARRAGREAATATAADRIEAAGDAFHARLRTGFLEMAAAEPDRIRVVDASGDVDDVARKILNAFESIKQQPRSNP